ncbi:MAG: hypothetical protein M3N49_00600 [Candidatus Eremiobacteraeota bacterium]|nr:hypothetical protein [Candidatus Eremiobacteraeota bacterium]
MIGWVYVDASVLTRIARISVRVGAVSGPPGRPIVAPAGPVRIDVSADALGVPAWLTLGIDAVVVAGRTTTVRLMPF